MLVIFLEAKPSYGLVTQGYRSGQVSRSITMALAFLRGRLE
jgi:hypothetical protein